MSQLLYKVECINRPVQEAINIRTRASPRKKIFYYIYSGKELASGTKVLTSGSDLEDAELLLVSMDIEKGKYVVNLTRKGNNLYKVDYKNIYIVTKYCYEYSYSKV
jgi:hypothetical protein